MSLQQLEHVIADIQTCFGAWTPDTSLAQMREDWDALPASTPSTIGARITAVDADGVRAEWIDTPGAAKDRVVMYLHGGGYVFGSSRSHATLTQQLSSSARSRILFVEYRLAPENPFPAAVEDATTTYRWLLKQGYAPDRIAFAGDSAGGGLAVATLVSLKRDGVPLPACATLLSPWVDMEATGATITSKSAEDPMVQKPMLDQLAGMYLPQGNLREPLASPLHADLSGLPPLLIQVGSREVLLDDSVRITDRAKRTGVSVELDICDKLIHVFQVFCTRLDEGRAAIDRLGGFIRRHTGGA